MRVRPTLKQRLVYAARGAIVVALATLAAIVPIYFAGASPPAESPEKGQAIFDQKCKSCHTIGGGRAAGPDLKGVVAVRDREWLVRIIVEPDKLIAAKDPLAMQLLQEHNNIAMPPLGVSPAEAADIIAYLTAASGASTAAGAPIGAGLPAPLPQGNAQRGNELFLGARTFQGGGTACVACHNAPGVGALGGGTLGPDLTGSAAKYGDSGLVATLGGMPFPSMSPIYAGRPLTPGEQADLTAYLRQVGAQPATGGTLSLLLLACGGLALLMALIAVLWRGRLSAVRAPMVATSISNRRAAR